MKRLLNLFKLVVPLILIFLLASPVGAAPANPSAISIGDVFVFRGVLETGDQLWFMRYDVSYTIEPSEDASDTFYMAIYGIDGITLKYLRGVTDYQHDIISIYLTPAQALTWGGAYYVKVMGNPALFDPLIEGTNMRTTALGTGNYFEKTDLGTKIIQQAEILQADWGPGFTLVVNGKLNTAGSLVFLEAIPGLNSMDSTIFVTTSSVPSTYGQSTNVTQAVSMTTKRGTGLTNAVAGVATIFGATFGATSMMIAVMFSALISGSIFAATKNPGWGLLIGAACLSVSAATGLLDWTLWTILVILVCFFGGVAFLRAQVT